MRALQQPNQLLIGVGIGLVLFAWFSHKANHLDRWSAANTKGIGEALSTLFARFNGWEPVTLKPLMIRDFYLTSDHRLTPEAKVTLGKIEEYQPLLTELFTSRDGQLKAHYRALINVGITRGNLSE